MRGELKRLSRYTSLQCLLMTAKERQWREFHIHIKDWTSRRGKSKCSILLSLPSLPLPILGWKENQELKECDGTVADFMGHCHRLDIFRSRKWLTWEAVDQKSLPGSRGSQRLRNMPAFKQILAIQSQEPTVLYKWSPPWSDDSKNPPKCAFHWKLPSLHCTSKRRAWASECSAGWEVLPILWILK